MTMTGLEVFGNKQGVHPGYHSTEGYKWILYLLL